MNEEDKKAPFVVRDRRRFDASGNRRGDEESAPTQKAAPASRPPEPSAAPRSAAPAQDRPPPQRMSDEELGPEGPVSFAEFLLSIATNAVIHMGGETHDGRLPARTNLHAAAQ